MNTTDVLLDQLVREVSEMRREFHLMITYLLENKTGLKVRKDARNALIRQAAAFVGSNFAGAKKLEDLLAGKVTAFGELGDLVEKIKRVEGARKQRQLYTIMNSYD